MKKVLLFSFLLFAFTVNSQDNLWEEASKSHLKSKSKQIRPSKYKVYKLDLQLLKEELKKAPKERENINISTVVLRFPDENGVLKQYKITEASVMDVQLQENHPTIKSYIGKSIDNSNSIIRFSISPYVGFSGIILKSTIPPTLIERDGNYYQVFSKKDAPTEENPFKCGVIDQVESKSKKNSLKKKTLINGKLRTYRLAMATTGEYSLFVLNELGISNSVSDTDKKSAILGYLNSIMTNVNAVFERDIAITMQLVAKNTDIIFLDAATDFYSSTSTRNQEACDNIIGNSNYDIGHLLYVGGGGWASLRSVCGSGKAGAISSSTSLRHYDVLLHEMGHQFGASHTFNSINYSNQLNPTTAIEVGSGRTIMSYGRGSERLFYHSVSIEQMRNFVQDKGNCASITNTGNTPPTADAGDDYIIPKSTPFLLEGTATDSDNSTLTYTWEQVDSEEGILPPVSIAPRGPVFKWLLPTTEPKRYMPNINTILNGGTAYKVGNGDEWEVIPSVSRDLNFAFLVRDNDTRGGETDSDQMTVTVDGNSGPFLVTSDNSPITWYSGSTQNLTWDVANTNTGAVNTPTVDVLFSTDGGITYTKVLASDIANNGSYGFKVTSDMATTQGRFMIKGHNNIFLDVNNADIIVEEKEFLMNIKDMKKDICLANSNSISYNFIYNSYLGFNGTVNFSASDLNGASISFSPASTSADGANITMTINNISATNIGSNIISITATSGSISHTNRVILNVFDNSLKTVSLTSPSNNATSVLKPFIFQWNADNNVNSYRIEISTDNSFSNIVESATVTRNSFASTILNYSTNYFWRVKPIDTCVNGAFSTVFSFMTQSEHLNNTYIPDDNFEQALIDLKLDSGTLDNYVLTANIKTFRSLDIPGKGITSLEGIENFTALTSLSCWDNQLTSLDVSANTALTDLSCSSNQLTSLDVSANTALTDLSCGKNKLTSLDVSANTALTDLSCGKNKLTSLDVSANTALTGLGCRSNQLTSLDVSANTALTVLSCGENQLTSLDVSANTALTRLWCSFNQLTSLDASANTALTQLWCHNNQLTSLDVSANTALTRLWCSSNQLTSLDVSANMALTSLEAQNNNLTFLNLKNGNNINFIWGSVDNSFDARGNPNLTCIQVDNASYSIANWTNVGNSSSFSEDCYDNTDIDNDGILYVNDVCPNTPTGESVNGNGCSELQIDADGDGVPDFDNTDICPNTPTGESVNENGCSKSQIVYIPDDNFEQALIDLKLDSGALDNYVLTANIKTLRSLDISGKRITSLEGIENFTALTQLLCDSNQLTSLDVSTNTALTVLGCWDNQLTSLDVSASTALTSLSCSSNQLTSLDVSASTALTSLSCSSNQLTSLDVSANTALTSLSCRSNQLTSLDVSANTALTGLSCSSNQLTSLDVSANTALTGLWCGGNQLTSLDVSANTALTQLWCYSNQLTSLDVSANKALTSLSCYSNQLTSLDVSANTALTGLWCGGNQLTSLDVSANKALTSLGCSFNQLTSLDVSANKALTWLDCYSNQLNNLNIKNMNNRALNNFDVTNNPNLTCIQVDNASYSIANWTNVGNSSSFSEDCYDNTDVDNDGIFNNIDTCPDTPTGEDVNGNGCSESQVDTDNDGIFNNVDQCPNTPTGEAVNENGCSESQVDTDNDGIFNNVDQCPNTPTGEDVNENGCSESQIDTDNDGIFNNVDQCTNTPTGEAVNENGCSESQVDTDNDGIFDNVDQCTNTPTGEDVNGNGCSESQIDTDNDGIFNNIDTCPDTPTGEDVNGNGCSESQIDTDNDGIFDNIDQCNNTPSGGDVNAIGCTQLSSNNFEISSTTPSCPNINNGKISIKNISSHMFNFVVTGPNSYNKTFENKLANEPFVIENLAVGMYNITAKFSTDGIGKDIPGFQVAVNGATPVSGTNKSVNRLGKSSVFTVSGDKKYSIYVNDVFQRDETFSDESEYDIVVENLSTGKNHIKIIPENICRGLIENWIIIPNGDIKFYPNPAGDLFHIAGLESSDINVQVFAPDGQQVYNKNHKPVNGVVYFSTRDLSAGFYIVRVSGDKSGDIINFKMTKK